MSQASLATIIGRAAVNKEYLELLKSNPDAIIIATPDLTDAEKNALKSLNKADLDALHSATENTTMRAFIDKKDA